MNWTSGGLVGLVAYVVLTQMGYVSGRDVRIPLTDAQPSAELVKLILSALLAVVGSGFGVARQWITDRLSGWGGDTGQIDRIEATVNEIRDKVITP